MRLLIAFHALLCVLNGGIRGWVNLRTGADNFESLVLVALALILGRIAIVWNWESEVESR